MIVPPQPVLDAVMAPVTTVTRRVEFYESDAETPWGDVEATTSALIDGTISVDSTRDERRSLDLTLDNSSGTFMRDPVRGFWYDKVIKVFRGIQYTAFEAYGELIQGQQPTLFWRMDNPVILQDLSGYGLHGDRVGFPVAARPLVDTPDSQGSVRFADVQTYFVSPAIEETHPAYSFNVWTLEAWVRPIGTGPDAGGQIFGRDALDYRIQVSRELAIQAVMRDVDGNAVIALTPNNFAVPGRIYHVAATYDGALLNLYVNGTLQDQKVASGVPLQATNGFAVGGDSTGQKQLRGDVDECVYYARVLSKNEIGQRYLSGTGRREIQHQWDVQIGEFLIDKIDESRFPKQTKITGRDFTKKCLLAKLPTAMSYPTDTPLEDFVRSMAANAGIKKFLLPRTGITIGSATDFDQGTERWNVMKTACESSAYELYFTPNGYLTMRRQLDPSTSAVTLTFKTGPNGNLVDWSKSSTDTEIYNRIICISQGNDSVLPFYGEASNTNPTSPTRIDRLGERTFIYTSAFFTSDEQCVQTANAMLKVKALESFNVDFNALVFPWTEAGEIIEFLDPDAAAYDPTRFLLSSFSIPLKLGSMTASAKRIIIIGDQPIVQAEEALDLGGEFDTE